MSGRTGQSGTVAAQQSAVPGTTPSVNTLNATVSVQGPYGQSILSDNALVGGLALRNAIQRGIAYNLGVSGLANTARQAHGQMRVALSSLMPNISGSLREVLHKNSLAAQGLRVAGLGLSSHPFFIHSTFATRVSQNPKPEEDPG